MALDEDTGTVLLAYGSLDSQARGTYEKIKYAYEQVFPKTSVVLALTSDTLRRRPGSMMYSGRQRDPVLRRSY